MSDLQTDPVEEPLPDPIEPVPEPVDPCAAVIAERDRARADLAIARARIAELETEVAAERQRADDGIAAAQAQAVQMVQTARQQRDAGIQAERELKLAANAAASEALAAERIARRNNAKLTNRLTAQETALRNLRRHFAEAVVGEVDREIADVEAAKNLAVPE